MSTSIRVMLVDDQALFREGLRTLLTIWDDIEVVGEAGNGQEAINLVATAKPDVILMDEPLGALDALTREKMQSLVLDIWKETGKTIMIITHSVEEALLLGERLFVMAPRPGRLFKEYNLPFAEMGIGADLREIKQKAEFGEVREEILTMIWNMEEEIMGKGA